MKLSRTRITAISRKELRDYRRNRFIIGTMVVMPLIFIALPLVQIFLVPASATSHIAQTHIGIALLYLLIIPTTVPAALSAYAVVGEREQGTLEPVLTTPITAEEFLIGKALAGMVPALAISYAGFGVFLIFGAIFANAAAHAAIFRGSEILAQLLFTPLLASWSIWTGIAMSTRSSDVRVAQQLSILASLPLLAVASLFSFSVIRPTFGVALAFAAPLLLIDLLGWRFVAMLFDRERLITGTKA